MEFFFLTRPNNNFFISSNFYTVNKYSKITENLESSVGIKRLLINNALQKIKN